MSSALLPSLSSETTPETAAALAAPVPPPEKRGRGRPTGGALPLPTPEAVRAMTPAALAAHLADVQRRAGRVRAKTDAALAALATLESRTPRLRKRWPLPFTSQRPGTPAWRWKSGPKRRGKRLGAAFLLL